MHCRDRMGDSQSVEDKVKDMEVTVTCVSPLHAIYFVFCISFLGRKKSVVPGDQLAKM